jgi:hypothetical protein
LIRVLSGAERRAIARRAASPSPADPWSRHQRASDLQLAMQVFDPFGVPLAGAAALRSYGRGEMRQRKPCCRAAPQLRALGLADYDSRRHHSPHLLAQIRPMPASTELSAVNSRPQQEHCPVRWP